VHLEGTTGLGDELAVQTRTSGLFHLGELRRPLVGHGVLLLDKKTLILVDEGTLRQIPAGSSLEIPCVSTRSFTRSGSATATFLGFKMSLSAAMP
jgi:hypothetical protein